MSDSIEHCKITCFVLGIRVHFNARACRTTQFLHIIPFSLCNHGSAVTFRRQSQMKQDDCRERTNTILYLLRNNEPRGAPDIVLRRLVLRQPFLLARWASFVSYLSIGMGSICSLLPKPSQCSERWWCQHSQQKCCGWSSNKSAVAGPTR
jgi:hypothetical protein